MDKYYKVKEVSQMLKMKQLKIYSKRLSGEIKVIKIELILIPKSELDKLTYDKAV